MRPNKIGLLLVLLLAFVGCQKLDLFRAQSPDKTAKDKSDDDDDAPAHGKTELIGEHASIAGNNVVTVHGAGLVTGLSGTGEDPPPSAQRTALVEDMNRRGVKQPNQILQSPNTAMVQLTAYIPADIRIGDPFDVEVRLPANSEATSLAGGWLMQADLTEKAILPGAGELDGKRFGMAAGPILISTGEGDAGSLTGVLKRGRILGGGRALRERDLGLYLRSDFKSFRNSKRVAERIGARFHYYEKGRRMPMAEAKTDGFIVLKVHPRYKNNYPRYMQVVRNIAFRETPVQQRDRMVRLAEEIAEPSKAAVSAVQLEAIGVDAIPFLKQALNNAELESRFYAAEALAYLGNEAGAEILGETIRTEAAFRVYGLAALAALDEAVSFEVLRKLLHESSAETRYGAFRALWTLDKRDPFIEGQKLNDQFTLHVLDTEGESMIHLTRHRVAEVVLFGAEQRFQLPLSLAAGSRINVNAGPGSDSVVVTKFIAGQKDERREVSSRVADVIVAAAELGATYPDIAQMLTQANNQFNAPGRIEIDALPQAGRLYYRPITNGLPGKKPKQTRVGGTGLLPNMFPATEQAQPEGDRAATESPPTGEASLADITTAESDKADSESESGVKKYMKLPWKKDAPATKDSGKGYLIE